jgi:hypothetical protein
MDIASNFEVVGNNYKMVGIYAQKQISYSLKMSTALCIHMEEFFQIEVH